MAELGESFPAWVMNIHHTFEHEMGLQVSHLIFASPGRSKYFPQPRTGCWKSSHYSCLSTVAAGI